MGERWTCGGSKDGKSSYDPQISAASAQSAATSAKAEQFSENYYNNVVAPLMQKTVDASTESQGKLNKLYDTNAQQMQTASDRYNQYGIPAENRYYQMARDYSSQDEFQRQAEAAKGDFATAAQGQQQGLRQRMASMGIDPTSPAAMSAMTDMAMRNTSAQAAAMNHARTAAKTLGMQLTGDAANFGRGGQSGILQFGAGAQGNATAAAGMAGNALGAATSASAIPMQGYQTALSGYNNNVNAYAGLGQQSITANQKNAENTWGAIGSLAGTAMMMM